MVINLKAVKVKVQLELGKDLLKGFDEQLIELKNDTKARGSSCKLPKKEHK